MTNVTSYKFTYIIEIKKCVTACVDATTCVVAVDTGNSLWGFLLCLYNVYKDAEFPNRLPPVPPTALTANPLERVSGGNPLQNDQDFSRLCISYQMYSGKYSSGR